MTAKELIRAGRLSEARGVLIEEVKSAPKDVGKRTLLFQVLAMGGEWDKAMRHLDMISTQDPTRLIGAHTYLDIVKAEQERLEVLHRSQVPSVMPEAPAYFPQYMSYINALMTGKFDDARSLIAEIDKVKPEISCTMDGKDFVGFSDTDARLYAFIEAFVHERYVWIPFETIRELVIHEPKTSFDLIWVLANITTWGGLSMNCYLPVMYPETYLHEDEKARLGRLTDWVPLGGGFSRGVGQHVYQVGDDDVSILDMRGITFKLAGG